MIVRLVPMDAEAVAMREAALREWCEAQDANHPARKAAASAAEMRARLRHLIVIDNTGEKQ